VRVLDVAAPLGAFVSRILGDLGADVIKIEPPGVERLSRLYPRLVWTAISPFGLSGPYSAYTGNNIVAEAMGGLMYIQGDDARPPCVSPCEQGLYLASLHTVCGTLLALWERRASGLGQVVEVCVHEVLANLYFLLVNYGLWSDIPYRIGTRNLMPPNGYYRCTTDAQWRALARLVGGEALADDAGLATATDRWARHDELDDRISAWTREQTPHQVMRQLQAVGVPAGVVQTAEDLWRDMHLRAREYTVTMAHPELGLVEHPGMMVRLHATPGRVQRLAGPLGEANEAVFRGLLGLSPEELSQLVEAGVIA
jgi:formyl-CoA transferase